MERKAQALDYKVLMFACIGGFIGAFALPSIATQYWMWDERPNYRWILILSWVAVILILVGLWLYLKRRKQ